MYFGVILTLDKKRQLSINEFFLKIISKKIEFRLFSTIFSEFLFLLGRLFTLNID